MTSGVKTRYVLLPLLAVAIVLLSATFAACHYGGKEKKQVLVMWSTTSSDPAYTRWNQLLEEEFRRQGIDAEIHPYYGAIGESREGLEEQRIRRTIHTLDSLGKCPDLVLAHGDYTHWNLLLNRDSLVQTIPAVAFGLKDRDWLPYQKEYLKKLDIRRSDIVHIYDSLCLKENLDFAAFVHNLRAEGDTVTRFPRHRFVSLLDRHSVWIDSIIGNDLRVQAEHLDTVRYLNCIGNPLKEKGFCLSLST